VYRYVSYCHRQGGNVLVAVCERFLTFGFILSNRELAKDVPLLGELWSMSYSFRVVEFYQNPIAVHSEYAFWNKHA